MTDLRTKAGREEEIIQEIKETGGLNVFWVTENLSRAYGVDRLIRAGKIKEIDLPAAFPFAKYEVRE